MFRTHFIVTMGGFFTLLLILIPLHQIVFSATTCTCTSWKIVTAPAGGATCKGGVGDPCGNTQQRICTAQKCTSDSSTCSPTTLSCANTCGQVARCVSNGCGGQTCCPATAVCVPTPTPDCSLLRPKGDANCDQVVNSLDFDIFKVQLQTIGKGVVVDSNPKSNADFNNDKKVTILDFEIWRNTFLK